MDKIPSVDLRDFLSGEPERKQKFVNEIGKAYEEIGFVALKGHFLDDKLVSELYGEVKNFFELRNFELYSLLKQPYFVFHLLTLKFNFSHRSVSPLSH